eukprot:1278130-Amphidinium_carterae.2
MHVHSSAGYGWCANMNERYCYKKAVTALSDCAIGLKSNPEHQQRSNKQTMDSCLVLVNFLLLSASAASLLQQCSCCFLGCDRVRNGREGREEVLEARTKIRASVSSDRQTAGVSSVSQGCKGPGCQTVHAPPQ